MLRDETREVVSSEWRELMERLPAFFRENPGLVEPVASLAGEMLAEARRELRSAEESLLRDGAERPSALDAWLSGREGAPSVSAGGDPLCGSPLALARWLEDLHGIAPEVWQGVEARPHPLGGIEIVPAKRPSAVIAWEKELLPAPPPGFEIPDAMLPAATRVQAILRARPAHGAIPHRGEKVAGEVFWTRDPAGAAERGGDGWGPAGGLEESSTGNGGGGAP